MPVQINITGENAEQAIQEFSILSSHFVSVPVAPVVASVSVEAPKEEKPKRPRTTKQPETKQETVEDSDDSSDDVETGKSDSSDDGESVPTDVELRAAATEKAKSAGKPKVKALLDKYEVPNVTGIPDDQRVEFLAELLAL